ncbi:Aste57867_8122 [Aphanomyces stellatus]|uniref:Aste57867_8122 protein n=1 Tax=Aphanomyces stellatus TaxID=120398 RepID=A0A485KJF0_9STRA|nr:hypothetical protein As57867_008092 [Aphanomyces stellatus]VFT85011.1 Aste57867_8122 [Aphanomyces stellatus]
MVLPPIKPTASGFRRHEMALLCAVGTILCYADRTNIGVAIPAFQPDHAVQGHILSAFFYGYIATQILGASAAATHGPKRVLVVGVVTWTVFDLLTIPFAHTPVLLWLARVGMGLGEGIIFPCMHGIAVSWYPRPERTRLNATVTSGMDLGTVVAMILSPWLMATYDFAAIFLTFGILCAMWVVVFAWRGADSPRTDALVTADEKSYIAAYSDPRSMTSTTRLSFTSPSIVAIYVSHFAYNYGWYVLLGWIPQYLRDQLHLELATSGVAAAIPYFCGYLGVLLWGAASDWLIARGVRVLTVRKTMNGLGLIGSAVCLYSLRFVATPVAAVGLLSFTLLLSRAACSGYWVNMLDVAPTHAAHLMGVSNTIATIPGIVGNIVTGQILASSGSWDLVFAIASAVLITGGLVFHVYASDVSQETAVGTVAPTDTTALLAK